MNPLSRLNHFYWKYKALFIPGLLAAIASAAFSIIVPMVVRQAVDVIPEFVSLHQTFKGTAAESDVYASIMVALGLFALQILCLSLGSGVFSFLMRRTVVVASRHIEYDLRNRLYAHLQTLSRDFYLSRATGDIITRATSDIEQIRRYMGPAVMYLTRALMVVITALIVMIVISPKLTLFAVIPMPFLAISVFLLARIVHHRSDALQAQYSRLTSRVQESLAGIRVLKAYTREDSQAQVFDKESDSYRARVLDLARVEAGWRPVFLLLVGMATIIVVWVGGRLAAQGEITIGNIAEYIIYVALMTWPVASMGFVITMVQRASASVTRLYEILDAKPTVEDTVRTDFGIKTIEGAIEFDEVSYRFDGAGAWSLVNVSFEVPAGSTLAIVGKTGAGKTTLIELIPRLLDPKDGVVRIDGVDVRDIPLQTLRSSIGYVPQDVFLFSDTVANNISFGNMNADEQQINAASEESDLLSNIESFPDGFDTFVGERGVTLSGGQKQRTSIARALIREPSILILDDALSAVDTHTERTILGHLRSHFGRRTIVIVSHRISAVQGADLILVLHEGEVTERGTHEQLVAQGGLYASLYEKQLLQEQIDALG